MIRGMELQFQSTLPARGATLERVHQVVHDVISIHAPREGSDRYIASQFNGFFSISIHAPREGSDLIPPPVRKQQKDFNPRSPRGERLVYEAAQLCAHLFQSTLPARGATYPCCR